MKQSSVLHCKQCFFVVVHDYWSFIRNFSQCITCRFFVVICEIYLQFLNVNGFYTSFFSVWWCFCFWSFWSLTAQVLSKYMSKRGYTSEIPLRVIKWWQNVHFWVSYLEMWDRLWYNTTQILNKHHHVALPHQLVQLIWNLSSSVQDVL